MDPHATTDHTTDAKYISIGVHYNVIVGLRQEYGDPRARNRCYVQETRGKPMQRPALVVLSSAP